jgi:hypothetical protein
MIAIKSFCIPREDERMYIVHMIERETSRLL